MSQTPLPQPTTGRPTPAESEQQEQASSREAPTPEPIPFRTPAEPAGSLVAKRALDVAVASVGLLLSAPLWVVLAAAIKLEDGGPVFFTQERVGKGGEHFMGYKFRSMTPREETGGPCKQAEKEPHRITVVGSFMRACALDELPQLLNVLKGDMSLVGPRALLPEEEHNGDEEPVRLEEIPGYDLRHMVRPGLTGIAQVRVPRDVSYRRKFRYDCFYVRNRSLALDGRLIVRSLWVSLCARWPEVGKSEETTYLS